MVACVMGGKCHVGVNMSAGRASVWCVVGQVSHQVCLSGMAVAWQALEHVSYLRWHCHVSYLRWHCHVSTFLGMAVAWQALCVCPTCFGIVSKLALCASVAIVCMQRHGANVAGHKGMSDCTCLCLCAKVAILCCPRGV